MRKIGLTGLTGLTGMKKYKHFLTVVVSRPQVIILGFF